MVENDFPKIDSYDKFFETNLYIPWNLDYYNVNRIDGLTGKLLGRFDEVNFWKYREYFRTRCIHDYFGIYKTINLKSIEDVPLPYFENNQPPLPPPAKPDGVFWTKEDTIWNKYHTKWPRFSASLIDHVPFELFPHVSTENDGLIAFTPSDRHGIQDRQVKMKIGKFLHKYCKHLTAIQIKDIANEYAAKYGKLELKWAEGAEIAEIYEWTHDGFSSCMSGDSHDFEGDQHPAVVYDSPDIKLAYLGDVNTKLLKARALINIDKKEYSTVYGNEQLINLLEMQGYTSGDLTGCKILKVPVEGSKSKYNMPYIDGNSYFDHYDDNYFIIGIGDYDASYTEGYQYVYDKIKCACCGVSMNEGEGYDTEDGEVCYSCYSSYVRAIRSSIRDIVRVPSYECVFSEYIGMHILKTSIGASVVYSNCLRSYILVESAIKVKNINTEETDYIPDQLSYDETEYELVA